MEQCAMANGKAYFPTATSLADTAFGPSSQNVSYNAPTPCGRDGHDYIQARDVALVIFCRRCASVQELKLKKDK